jgi:hypothetical protein
VPVLAFALLIAVMAWGRGPIAAMLRWKPLVLLGEISFSAYLVHRVLLHFYWEHFAPDHGPWPIAIYVAVLLAASFVFWSFVEVPCRQIIVKGPAAWPRPTLKASLAPSLALAFVMVVWFGIWSGAPLERLDLASAKAEIMADTVAGANPGNSLGDIAFGDDLLLLGTKTARDSRGLTVTLYWQALRDQQLQNNIGVKLLSETNQLVRFEDYRQSLKEEVVDKDECFKNQLFVPASELGYVQRFAFCLVRPIGNSPAVRIVPNRQGADRPELYQDCVALQIGPQAVAGKETKPAL